MPEPKMHVILGDNPTDQCDNCIEWQGAITAEKLNQSPVK